MTEHTQNEIRRAFKLAIQAMEDYRRRHFAIGHNSFVKGIVMTFTEKDNKSYEQWTEGIQVVRDVLSEEIQPVYADTEISIPNLTPEQNQWLNLYQGATCIEPMFLEDLEAGTMTFREAADQNIRWYESHFADAMNAISRDIPA